VDEWWGKGRIGRKRVFPEGGEDGYMCLPGLTGILNCACDGKYKNDNSDRLPRLLGNESIMTFQDRLEGISYSSRRIEAGYQ
jgi:hypothetical protein